MIKQRYQQGVVMVSLFMYLSVVQAMAVMVGFQDSNATTHCLSTQSFSIQKLDHDNMDEEIVDASIHDILCAKHCLTGFGVISEPCHDLGCLRPAIVLPAANQSLYSIALTILSPPPK